MTDRDSAAGKADKSSTKGKADKRHQPTEPVNVIDGIPDRCESRPAWKYVLIVAIFVFWLAVLVFIQMTGRPQ